MDDTPILKYSGLWMQVSRYRSIDKDRQLRGLIYYFINIQVDSPRQVSLKLDLARLIRRYSHLKIFWFRIHIVSLSLDLLRETFKRFMDASVSLSLDYLSLKNIKKFKNELSNFLSLIETPRMELKFFSKYF